MNIQALPFIVMTAICFGTSLIASRFGIGQFHPTLYAGLRLAIAASCFLLVYLFNRRLAWPTDPTLWKRAGLLGIIGTAVPMVTIISSLQYQSSGVTSVLLAVGPALTIVLAHFFFTEESLSRRKGLGVFLALLGAVLLAVQGETGLPDVTQASPIGYGLIFLALISISAAIVFTRKYLRHYQQVHVTSIQMFSATLIVLPLSILFVGFDLSRVTWQGYVALGYSGLIGTFVAFSLFFITVKRFGATEAALSDYVVPVIASVGGVLLLNEQVTGGMLVGAACVLVGLALINVRQRSQPQQSLETLPLGE